MMSTNIIFRLFDSTPLMCFEYGKWSGPIPEFIRNISTNQLNTQFLRFSFEDFFQPQFNEIPVSCFVGIFPTEKRIRTHKFSIPIFYLPVFLCDASGKSIVPGIETRNKRLLHVAQDIAEDINLSLFGFSSIQRVTVSEAGLITELKTGNSLSSFIFLGDSLTLVNRLSGVGKTAVFSPEHALFAVPFCFSFRSSVSDDYLDSINFQLSKHSEDKRRLIERLRVLHYGLSFISEQDLNGVE